MAWETCSCDVRTMETCKADWVSAHVERHRDLHIYSGQSSKQTNFTASRRMQGNRYASLSLIDVYLRAILETGLKVC